jgi:hypothetical protein
VSSDLSRDSEIYAGSAEVTSAAKFSNPGERFSVKGWVVPAPVAVLLGNGQLFRAGSELSPTRLEAEMMEQSIRAYSYGRSTGACVTICESCLLAHGP